MAARDSVVFFNSAVFMVLGPLCCFEDNFSVLVMCFYSLSLFPSSMLGEMLG
jgi:hypothetical protein